MSDVTSILIWWLTIFLIGLTCLPISYALFSRFIDKGYAFSKVLSLLLSSYVVWLLSSLHIAAFSQGSILVTILILVGINSWFYWNYLPTLKDIPWKWMLVEEVLFFLALAGWSYVRANEPSIHGLEKFMDYGFVNSILRTQYFPPLDMWLAKSPEYQGGQFINYYYYGHYINAFLTKLAGLDSAITYNLMIATLFAFTFTLPFSLGINLVHLYIYKKTHKPSHITHNSKLILIGLLAAFLVSLGGNLHTLYVFTSGYPNETPVPPWDKSISFGFHPEKYWYPNATRFIPFTIHEFPLYSFVVADLHGHVSDIPLVLLCLALLLSLITKDDPLHLLKSPKDHLSLFLYEFETRTAISPAYLLLLGLLLATMYMTNAWDGPIYMVICGAVFLYLNIKAADSTTWWKVIYRTTSACLFLIFIFLLTSFPFSFNFRPFVSGIGFLCSPKDWYGKHLGPLLFEADKCQRSPLYMMITLWGFFYYTILGYLLFIFLPRLRKKYHKEHAHKSGLLARLSETLSTTSPVNIFLMIVVLISTLLLIFPEIFYLKDIYPQHYRANTMFKLGYQAFMMLGIVCSYVFFRLRQWYLEKSQPIPPFNKAMAGIIVGILVLGYLFSVAGADPNATVLSKPDSIGIIIIFVGILVYIIFRSFQDLSTNRHLFLYDLYRGILLIMLGLVAIYPSFAINSYYGDLKTYNGLDGLAWLKNQYPDDYNAIMWIRKQNFCLPSEALRSEPNNSGSKTSMKEGLPDSCNQPVILEANGDSYTDYDRVSANTGLPTVVGWPVHEWLWRGSYDEAGKRIPEVETMYTSEDLAATKDLLHKYNVKYIFVGSLEREKYKGLNTKKIETLGKKVFESGNTKIYRVTS